MPTLRSVSAAEGANDPDAQFNHVYGLLDTAFAADPEFFNRPLYGSSVIRADEIKAKLAEARDEYFSGAMGRQAVVRLLGAHQAPDAAHPAYRQANAALTNLYSLFYARFGRQASTYEDIEHDAQALAADPHVPRAVRLPMDGIYATTQSEQAAIIDGRTQQLTGIQLQLTEDIYANFVLGNFGKGMGDESAASGMSYVELLVAPPGDQLPLNPYE